MRLFHGLGKDTVLLDLVSRRFISFETDELPAGVEHLHTSQTGKVGVGRVDLHRYPQFIRCGTYRTDIWDLKITPGDTISGVQIFVPIRAHRGIDHNSPLVLRRTFGYDDHIILTKSTSNANNVLSILANWPEEGRKIEITKYNGDLATKTTLFWHLTVVGCEGGIDASRFLSENYYPRLRAETRIALEGASDPESAVLRTLGFHRKWQSCHFRLNKQHTIDMMCQEEPPLGYIGDGWWLVSSTPYMAWKRNKDLVRLIRDGQDGIEERMIPLTDFFHTWIDPYKETTKDILRVLGSFPLLLGDFPHEEWMNQLTGFTASDLLNHQDLDRMLIEHPTLHNVILYTAAFAAYRYR